MESNSGQTPPIKISNIIKTFPKSGEIFNNLSLEICEGEFVTLLGPSGCGKSTILRMISGLEPFEGGLLENHFVTTQAMVFQDPALIPWRTALENVMLPFEISRNKVAENNLNIAMDSLELVGLNQYANLFPKELSGGMRMRVSLARALAQKPKLLLLDEPFAALDENIRERLQEDLSRIRQKLNMTIVFVTHSIPEAVFLSERIVILSNSPSQILFDDKIRLTQNRNSELRNSAEFFYELKRVRSHFPKSELQVEPHGVRR